MLSPASSCLGLVDASTPKKGEGCRVPTCPTFKELCKGAVITKLRDLFD